MSSADPTPTFDPTVDPEVQGPLQAPEPTIDDGLVQHDSVRELPVPDFEPYRDHFDVHEFIEDRWRQDRDIRIIWTGRNSGVGLGKTTGALSLAKEHYPEFDAERHAAMSPKPAIHLLRTAPIQSAPILDEIGRIADNRRSNSSDNVELTQLLQMCRYRQYLLQATLPSVRALDVRIVDMADLRIHVTEQGKAKIFRYDTPDSDTKGELIPKILQYIEWDPIDHDPDYQYLSEMKDDIYDGLEESSLMYEEEHERILEDEVEAARKQERQDLLAAIYENSEHTYADIGEWIGLTGERVGQIIRQAK